MSRSPRRPEPAPPPAAAPPAPGPAEWARREGLPYPLGVRWVPDERAYNFALYSKYATRVTLLLFHADELATPAYRYEFDYLRNKTGQIWHCRLPAAVLNGASFYGYQVDGPPACGWRWHAYDVQKLLLDPYAQAVFFPPGFDRDAARRPGCNIGRAPLGVLRGAAEFDWGDDRPPRHGHDLIIYELHVRGFTQNPNSGVSAARRGTFAGLIEKIPYLQELGVTAVELMPVFQCDPEEGSAWGYMPLSFFAVHDRYCATPEADERHNEFRTLVKALHAADIEVFVDVVYNHTCEGNELGPNYSYKGIDNKSYYLLSGDPERPYRDFTGCGNTMHAANRHVRRLMVESLTFWADSMRVDGFRFDLASALFRRTDGTLDPNPTITLVAHPQLAHVRWIVEPWDAAGGYQLGRSFPAGGCWQWNDRYRDTIRRFVRGEEGLVGELMSRLYGSADLFPDDREHGFRPFQSINYIASHDGFTLYDLTAYETKRNEANGHENTDGPRTSYSWNCGFEGDLGAPGEVRALREQQVRNFFTLLMLSNGTPMFRAGDEFLQTQGGNNNPYNQDNETWWLDWARLEQNRHVFRFFREMIALRRAHPSIGRSHFWREDVRWFGEGPEVDWSPASRCLAYCLAGARVDDDDLYVMINGSDESRSFRVCAPGPWRRAVDTSLPSPQDILAPESEEPVTDDAYEVAARSVVVLRRPRSA